MSEQDAAVEAKQLVTHLKSRIDLLETVIDLQNKNYQFNSRIVAVEEKFASLTKSIKLAITVAMFFFVIIQGCTAWYMQKFIDRADKDHDVLVTLAAQLNVERSGVTHDSYAGQNRKGTDY